MLHRTFYEQKSVKGNNNQEASCIVTNCKTKYLMFADEAKDNDKWVCACDRVDKTLPCLSHHIYNTMNCAPTMFVTSHQKSLLNINCEWSNWKSLKARDIIDLGPPKFSGSFYDFHLVASGSNPDWAQNVQMVFLVYFSSLVDTSTVFKLLINEKSKKGVVAKFFKT